MAGNNSLLINPTSKKYDKNPNQKYPQGEQSQRTSWRTTGRFKVEYFNFYLPTGKGIIRNSKEFQVLQSNVKKSTNFTKSVCET